MVKSKGRQIAAIASALAALAALGALAPLAAADEAPVGARVKSFKAVPSTTQAGGHPDLEVVFELGTRIDPLLPGTNHANQVKNALVETPEGFIGDPHAVAECTGGEFLLDICPADAQVGYAEPGVVVNDGCCIYLSATPVYNLVPEPGQAGLLAFKGFGYGFPIFEEISARTNSDYGLNTEVRGIGASFGLMRFRQILWGVPASPANDALRFVKGGNYPVPGPVASNLPEKPFLFNPTSCVGPLTARLVTTGYDRGVNSGTSEWPATTGCDQLSFNPSLSAKPSTSEADTASGLDTVLKVPQSESPETPASSEIKEVRVTLPEGFSINPSAADGKTACDDVTEARIGTTEEARCPQESKVGTLRLDSSALPEPITGGVYLGKPKPGERYRLIITADGFGTHVKLAGTANVDPRTGQLQTVFKNLPQSPYTEFTMHFFGSERGLLATPNSCGTYRVHTDFVPWDNELPDQASDQFFQIDSGPGGTPCPGAARPFDPSLRAVGGSNGAGAHSPFSILIQRRDGDQTLSTISVDTPPGFTATLKGIPACPDAALREIETSTGLGERANSKCPAASQVGVSTAGAGAGTRPVYVGGKVYLAGPYRGAPLSFAVVTPAVSGPYDLGNVVNRVAVHVDPTTAAVSAVSDPLPQIIEGIPLRLRTVLINLDRKDFTLNPTSCKPFDVEGLLSGDQGGTASPSSHFQVANCDTLDFAPKLRTVLTGPTKRTGHPALKATLTQDPNGAANIGRVVVALPHSEFLDQANLQTICTRVQFAADKCPANSVYGKARAFTPLLDQPLEGLVYLRSSSNKLPDLVAALKGPATQPIEIDLVGRIDSINGGIRTTFGQVPDTPVTKFVLSMRGGKRGLLVNSTNICRGKHFVDARIVGQNGDRADQRPLLKAPCGSGAGKKSKRQKNGRTN